MYKFLIFFVIFLSGCNATTRVLPSDVASSLQGKTITTVKEKKVAFEAHTAKGAMTAYANVFAPSGWLVIGSNNMFEVGDSIVNQFSIEDPSTELETKITNLLAEYHGMKLTSNQNKIPDDFSSTVLSETYSHADYILNIRTNDFGFMHYGSDWDKYRVRYSSTLYLIDTKSKKTVFSRYCHNYLKKDEDSPTLEALLENNAKLLKVRQKELADICYESFRSALLAESI